MCMLQDSVYCPKCFRKHMVCFDVLFAYNFDAVTGGKGMVQLKIGTAKNHTITGSDQHQRTKPLATTTLPRLPTLRLPHTFIVICIISS
jgi:hypothetical protein